jgi:hypothetical protein
MNETAFDHGTASVALGRALFKSESGRKLAAAGPVERTPAFRKKARVCMAASAEASGGETH